MELDDIRLDDETFRDLTRSCNLEQHWRPQVRAPRTKPRSLLPAPRVPALALISLTQTRGFSCSVSFEAWQPAKQPVLLLLNRLRSITSWA